MSALDDPATCRACRGTGRVISSRGDTPHPVDCPWCEGSGTFIPAHDAQEAARAGKAPDA
jgi:DnaJ-class molecular chaperone